MGDDGRRWEAMGGDGRRWEIMRFGGQNGSKHAENVTHHVVEHHRPIRLARADQNKAPLRVKAQEREFELVAVLVLQLHLKLRLFEIGAGIPAPSHLRLALVVLDALLGGELGWRAAAEVGHLVLAVEDLRPGQRLDDHHR